MYGNRRAGLVPSWERGGWVQNSYFVWSLNVNFTTFECHVFGDMFGVQNLSIVQICIYNKHLYTMHTTPGALLCNIQQFSIWVLQFSVGFYYLSNLSRTSVTRHHRRLLFITSATTCHLSSVKLSDAAQTWLGD